MSNSNTTRRQPHARRLPWLAVAAITAALAVVPSAARASTHSDADEPVETTPSTPATMVPAFGDDGPQFFIQDGGTAEWYHTSGTQTITRDGTTFTRRVEVWVAPDGRYRAKSTSLNELGAYEEVAYDGRGNQLVLIGNSNSTATTATVLRNSTHFAVTGLWNGQDVRHPDMRYSNLLVSESSIAGTAGSMHYIAGAVLHQQGDASTLAISVPSGVNVSDGSSLAGTSSSTSGNHSTQHDAAGRNATTGSRVMDLTDLYSRPCIQIHNFRNSVTNEYRTASIITADTSEDLSCYWTSITIWSAGYLYGWCEVVTGFVDHTGVRTPYVNWTGFFEVTGIPGYTDVACSTFYAYDRYWTPHVSLAHLSASIRG